VNKALRAALGEIDGDQQMGIVQTLGVRRDVEARDQIAAMLNDQNPSLVRAAIEALGRIGGKESIEILQSAQVVETLETQLYEALLDCASSLRTEGLNNDATGIYSEIFKKSRDPAVRAGALKGLIATNAGKDVYVEKPLGISIEEDKLMRKVVHDYGAIFQYGTQQRSFNQHCGFAAELVRNGYIGELQSIDVVAPNGATGGDPDPQPVPRGLDYDMWMGPAPVKPYTHDRVVDVGRWHIYDYAIGFIAGWGAHPLDVAHWGYPHIPIEYEGNGLIPQEGLF
jgi:hypothetical protein